LFILILYKTKHNGDNSPKEKCRQLKKFRDHFYQNIIPLMKKQVAFKSSITEMYPRIPWELVADIFESAEHTLETTDLRDAVVPLV